MNLKDLDKLSHVQKKRHVQKMKIVKKLCFSGPKRISEICNDCKISHPTFTSLAGQLIAEGLIKRSGQGKSEGGRRPDLFGLSAKCFYLLGIDIDQFRIKMALVDTNGNILEKVDNLPVSKEKVLLCGDQVFKLAQNFIGASGIDFGKLAGIGVSTSGSNFLNEKNIPVEGRTESLKQVIQDGFSKSVFVSNKAQNISLGELYFGRARNKKNVLIINMDWEISLGIIVEGRKFSGASGLAGQFGHTRVVENGELCYCGKRGCLETAASGRALVKKAKKGISCGQSTLLKENSDKEKEEMKPQEIIEAANNGDQFSINVLSEIGLWLGKGIATLIQILNPELIILEGVFAEAKHYITTPIEQSLNSYCLSQLRKQTDIVLSDLNQDAGLLGSVAAVLEELMEVPYKLNSV